MMFHKPLNIISATFILHIFLSFCCLKHGYFPYYFFLSDYFHVIHQKCLQLKDKQTHLSLQANDFTLGIVGTSQCHSETILAQKVIGTRTVKML